MLKKPNNNIKSTNFLEKNLLNSIRLLWFEKIMLIKGFFNQIEKITRIASLSNEN